MRRRESPPFDRQLCKYCDRGALPDKLPLVHVTPVWSANEIVSKGRLETRNCTVFDKQLLYFFVLKPVYRSRYGTDESHQLSRFPVAFVVSPKAVAAPLHVYPFDTGGAAKGAFAQQADPYVPLEDYALEPTHAAAAGHIGWAFGTLENYFEGVLKDDLLDNVPPFEIVTRGYVDVARMGRTGSNIHDKRASTLEIAASHDVDLKGHILVAVIPRQYLEGNTAFVEKLTQLNIPTELYDWQPNTMPDQFQDEITQIVRTKLGI
jgi:hypothetical protein